MPRCNLNLRNFLVIAILPVLLAAGCGCNAAPPQNLESTLETVLSAWVKGDRTLAGHASNGARIEFDRVVGTPNLVYGSWCGLGSDGRGSCEALYDTPSGGYSDILALRYHRASSGKIIIDSALWAGNAG